MENDFYSIESSTNSCNYIITMFSTIEYNTEYRDLYTFFSSINKEDTVKLILGSDGGSVEVATMIVNSIKACKANVDIELAMPCYSSSAIIALSGSSLIMNPNTFLMFHNQSCDYKGKHNSSLEFMTANEKQYSELLQRVCYPFLTKPEIKQVLNDKDLYIHYDDIKLKKRLDKHFGE